MEASKTRLAAMVVGLLAALGLYYQFKMTPCCVITKGESAKSEMMEFETALDRFRSDCGRYPTDAEGLIALCVRPPGLSSWNGPYSTWLPVNHEFTDPSGEPYRYRRSFLGYVITGHSGMPGDDTVIGSSESP